MPARRSLTGVGRISLIYTLGTDDPSDQDRPTGSTEPVLTASVGEDFAECRWPVTLKAQAGVPQRDLYRYVGLLADSVARGFYMDPDSAPALYWKWTGCVPPGMHPDDAFLLGEPISQEQALGTGRRSPAGAGRQCGIYLMDDAANWQRNDFYGWIKNDTAISGSVDEDFATTHWPVVVKAHREVDQETLARHLSNLAACIHDGFFLEVTPSFV